MRSRGSAVIIALIVCGGMGVSAQEVSGEERGIKEGTQWLHHTVDLIPSAEIATTLGQLEPDGQGERSRGAGDVALFEKLADGVVLLKHEQGLGSGAVIFCEDEYCLAATNWHVVGERKNVQVYFRPRRGTDEDARQAASGVVLIRDSTRDLAMVAFKRLTKRPLPIFPLAELQSVQIGEDVSAIGHPLGLTWSYAKGIISNISNQEWGGAKNEPKHRATVIQTQTPISPGNSGGPLVNEKGELIGVNTMSLSVEHAQNLNFAIAVNEVRDLFVEMMKEIQKQQQAEAAPPPAAKKQADNCTQNYSQDSAYAIVGCFIRVASPPPDTWIVADAQQWLYNVHGYLDSRRLDAVVFPAANSGQRAYIDGDCDGRVDVITDVDNKGRTSHTLVMKSRALMLASLAPQLDNAIQKGHIPFKMSFCR